MTHYEDAKREYEQLGIDPEKAMTKLAETPVSMHCWQGDDVIGFDGSNSLSGGIQTTGNYPGKARTPEELLQDIEKVLSLVPGKKKLNLHASYAIKNGDRDRDELKPEDFQPWIDFSLKHDMGLDFNPTIFSHSKAEGLTLSSADPETAEFWIRHVQACIRISEEMARQTGQKVVMNIWIPDGLKDVPGSRLAPRKRYKEALDKILSMDYDRDLVKVALESKVFGIGMESYTVGSAEMTFGYAIKNNLTPLMDNGHYHPTEVVSDKISAALLLADDLALHITRPVRWDSDHVVLFDDETREIAKEVVRCNPELDRVYLATDFFDASINRIVAWTVGLRNVQKALLYALLQPNDRLEELQNENRFSELMVLQEELKTLPFEEIWREYCRRSNVDASMSWLEDVLAYENDVLAARK